MPSTRITLALNSNRSQKCPLLIPSSTSYSPIDPISCRSLVIKAAQSKLRLKKASRVFVAGTGQELLEESQWKRCMEDDVMLLISAGEDFVGTKKEEPPPGENTTPDLDALSLGNPVYIMANKAYVDPLSITQLETTARTLPGIIRAVAQPDLHPGTKFPIGAVFVSDGWIHPPLIGGDIGCGMAWYKTTLSASQVHGDKGRKVAEKLRGLEGAWRTQPDREVWLSDTDPSSPTAPPSHSASASAEWDAALGTIGAGNHFAEIQVVEEVRPGAWQATNPHGEQGMLHVNDVVLLVHSGSRGYGGAILARHAQTSLPAADSRAQAYLAEHDRACAWATRNRDLIALRFLACLEPSDPAWTLGRNNNNLQSPPSSASHVRAARQRVLARKVVDICHNSVERARWPPTDPADPAPALPLTQRDIYIHRKGAAPITAPLPALQSSSSDSTSTPTLTPVPLALLPLPGSRGTPTLILHPLRTATTAFGAAHALSLAHGAGRALSRAKALAVVAQKYEGRAEDLLRGDYVRMDGRGNKRGGGMGGKVGGKVGGGKVDGGISGGKVGGKEDDWEGRDVCGGTWVVCEDQALVWEEAPEAYKDVWDVGDDLVDGGAAERVGWCWGRVSYKVRRE
ncbi:hypothetical protein MMC32_007274 [Xylographa parallela]|nr:hypothetical protein [Xylographa parallela]